MQKLATQYPEVNDIKGDLRSLKTHAGDLASHVKADGREKLDHLADQAQNRMHEMQERGQQQLHRAELYVKENPVQSIVYAFIGGLAAALLLGRR